jgi:hypothetical protein
MTCVLIGENLGNCTVVWEFVAPRGTFRTSTNQQPTQGMVNSFARNCTWEKSPGKDDGCRPVGARCLPIHCSAFAAFPTESRLAFIFLLCFGPFIYYCKKKPQHYRNRKAKKEFHEWWIRCTGIAGVRCSWYMDRVIGIDEILSHWCLACGQDQQVHFRCMWYLTVAYSSNFLSSFCVDHCYWFFVLSVLCFLFTLWTPFCCGC